MYYVSHYLHAFSHENKTWLEKKKYLMKYSPILGFQWRFTANTRENQQQTKKGKQKTIDYQE